LTNFAKLFKNGLQIEKANCYHCSSVITIMMKLANNAHARRPPRIDR
jgi:hypothetical protein